MLIDTSYFTKGRRHIVNATLGAPTPGRLPVQNATEVNETIGAYIEEEQERFLVFAMGEREGRKAHAYLVFLDEYEAPDRDEEESESEEAGPQRDEALDAVLAHLREPFADYVFFHMLRDMNEQATIDGLVRLKCANTYVSPMRRMVNTWNAMVQQMRGFAVWAKSKECPIPGMTVHYDLLTTINQFNI